MRQQQQQQQQLNQPKTNKMQTEPKLSWQPHQQPPTVGRVSQQQQLFDNSEPEDAEDEEVKAFNKTGVKSEKTPAKTAKTSSNINQGGDKNTPLSILSKVENLCHKTIGNILANLKNDNAVIAEEELWKTISKDYRNNLVIVFLN